MTTLVTGATGLLGSHVTRKLVERGDDVRALVRARSPVDTLDGLDVEFVRGDILDRRSVRRAMRGVDRVFHVAGLTGLRASAVAHVTVNVQGTRVVLEEALRAGRRARGAHVVGRRRGPGAARLHRRREARSSTPRATTCPTSTPSTRPRPWRCASPRRGCPS